MKREYDFSRAEQGKFFQEGTVLDLPVYLDPELRRELEKLAEERKTTLDQMIHALLREDVKRLRESR